MFILWTLLSERNSIALQPLLIKELGIWHYLKFKELDMQWLQIDELNQPQLQYGGKLPRMEEVGFL